MIVQVLKSQTPCHPVLGPLTLNPFKTLPKIHLICHTYLLVHLYSSSGMFLYWGRFLENINFDKFDIYLPSEFYHFWETIVSPVLGPGLSLPLI